MGITLRPHAGQPPLTPRQFASKLRKAGLVVKLDRAGGKRSIIEQITFTYAKHMDQKRIHRYIFWMFDGFVEDYRHACKIRITDRKQGISIETNSTNRIWEGEVYPTKKDRRSRFVMRIGRILGYEAEGD